MHLSSQGTRFYLKYRHETVLFFAKQFLQNPPPPKYQAPTTNFHHKLDSYFVAFAGESKWELSTAKQFWNVCDEALKATRWMPVKVIFFFFGV